jgi:hypothetical protein
MSEINLIPPEPEPTVTDKLQALNIIPVWDGHWRFPGLVTDYGDVVRLGELMDDEEADVLVKKRDRETVNRLVNGMDPELLEVDEDTWRDIFDYYSEGNYRGPSINVKLHDTYDYWRIVENGLGFEFPDEWEIDPEYQIWNDTIEQDWDWYMDTVIPEDHPSLDPKKFMRLGRSGGHLVYDIGEHYLNVAEAWDFMQLEKVAPKYVRSECAEVVSRQAAYALIDRWEIELDEWRDGEEEAVAEAVRTNNLKKATWHQANIDAAKGREFFDHSIAHELVWGVIWEHDKNDDT